MTNRVLKTESSCLLIIDIQEAFRKSIPEFDSLISKTVAAAKGFEALGRPVLVTEQYPRGLGKTVTEISDSVSDAVYFEKSEFSACGAVAGMLREKGLRDVAVAGIEAHVCVNQTVHGLLNEGFRVHLIEDAIKSRFPSDRETALLKMRMSGAVPSSVEMALFEMLVDSRSPEFKEIQSFIK